MEEDIKSKEIEIKDSLEILENTDISTIEQAENIDLYTYSYAVKTALNYIRELEADNYEQNNIISNQIDIIKNSVSKDKIKERIEILNKGIKEFKGYVADSTGEEKQFYKKQLIQLVSARNELLELLEGDEQMTDKEKKAIEILKNYTIKEGCKKCIVPNREACVVNGSDCIDEAIETTLNLIQKQQEEIEKKDEKIENLKATLASTYAQYLNNSIEKEKQHEEQLQALNEGWKIELEKKDKIIDEMAETLSAVCTGISEVREQFEKCYCEFMNTDKDCCWKTDKRCKDCIKQYFEKKGGKK